MSFDNVNSSSKADFTNISAFDASLKSSAMICLLQNPVRPGESYPLSFMMHARKVSLSSDALSDSH